MATHNVVMQPLSPELGWSSYQSFRVERWQGRQQTIRDDYVAEEVPVSLVYNGHPHVVMLATPTDLEDFALGFSQTEGIVGGPSEISSMHVYNRSNGIEVRMQIPEHRFSCLSDKGRNLTGRTGCGLCGASTLQQAVRDPAAVGSGFTLSTSDLHSALKEIRHRQTLNQLTGAVHAAAWVVPGQGLLEVREDVGRHNALDKLIGVLLRSRSDLTAGFVLMTSRASYELIQKASSVGITTLAAISAPTGLAIRLASESGMTLIGFVRDEHHTVYTHPYRLHHNAPIISLMNSSNEY